MSKNQTVTKNEINYQSELKAYTTKSAKIRFLASKNVSRSEIALMLNIRYQHVRNVLITPINSK